MKNVNYKIIIFLVWVPGYFLLSQTFRGIPLNLKRAVENSISLKTPMLIGQYFIGAPYLSNRLSKSNPEKVYYSFVDFDCITYVENVLALYNSKANHLKFKENLIKIRYNDSISYESRNHYLTSGLEKLIKLEFIAPINNQFNSKFVQKDISFLSKHVINKHVDNFKVIKIEKSISNRPIYYFDSTEKYDLDTLIQNGDVIAFISSRKDLDFKHVGFVYIKNNKKYILHASQEKKIVCISDLTIDQYLLKNKKITGFQIYRPII